MPRKRKSTPRRLTRKYEEDWGENFGKWIDKRGREFAEEMEGVGERFERRAEKHGKRWFDVFGVIGPLISSIIGIVFLGIGIWFLNLINLYLGNIFIFLLSRFLFDNIYWLFLASLLFGYCNYSSRKYQKSYWLVSPIVTGTKVAFIIWFFVSLISIVSTYTAVGVIGVFLNFLYGSIWAVFFLVIFIGYAFEFAKKIFYTGYLK